MLKVSIVMLLAAGGLLAWISTTPPTARKGSVGVSLDSALPSSRMLLKGSTGGVGGVEVGNELDRVLYDRIKVGMTLSEVEKILGPADYVKRPKDATGDFSVTWWPRVRAIVVGFVAGKVASKVYVGS